MLHNKLMVTNRLFTVHSALLLAGEGNFTVPLPSNWCLYDHSALKHTSNHCYSGRWIFSFRGGNIIQGKNMLRESKRNPHRCIRELQYVRVGEGTEKHVTSSFSNDKQKNIKSQRDNIGIINTFYKAFTLSNLMAPSYPISFHIIL